jgi:hypothetical protein
VISSADHAMVSNRHFRYFPADLPPPALAIGGISVCA